MRYFLLSLGLVVWVAQATAQHLPASVQAIHTNLFEDSLGVYILTPQGTKAYEVKPDTFPTLSQMIGTRTGYKDGIEIDFHAPQLNGRLYYGFIPYGDGTFPYPVYVRRSPQIIGGKAQLPIRPLQGKYDMIGWEESGLGDLGYRIVDEAGNLLYDGKITFRYDKQADAFEAVPTFIEGPLRQLPPFANGYLLGFKRSAEPSAGRIHEWEQGFGERFAPANPDSFTFAYASDCRDNQGGGERNIFGVNAYTMKRIGALCANRGVAFLQFTGDMIDGYNASADIMRLQYANFKRSLEPYWGTFPIVCAPGNHEVYVRRFEDPQTQQVYMVDNFPYETNSSESLFAAEFVNPVMGPTSEDGSKYDPDPSVQNFPPYGETVYTYSYGNVAVVALNSNYWYTVIQRQVPHISGNIHAYIMDNQLQWLAGQLDSLEKDDRIRHVFVTCHTPLFPNGGHVRDDMWYGGDNSFRPYVAGKPVERGIIERRDEILDLLINKSTKVRATLTGDEHNYCRTHITEEMPRYPEGWDKPKLKLSRSIWQLNNGSAGAPYYAQEPTPWSGYTVGFTTQVALILLHINGEKIEVEVQNPDTLEEIDRFWLN